MQGRRLLLETMIDQDCESVPPTRGIRPLRLVKLRLPVLLTVDFVPLRPSKGRADADIAGQSKS